MFKNNTVCLLFVHRRNWHQFSSLMDLNTALSHYGLSACLIERLIQWHIQLRQRCSITLFYVPEFNLSTRCKTHSTSNFPSFDFQICIQLIIMISIYPQIDVNPINWIQQSTFLIADRTSLIGIFAAFKYNDSDIDLGNPKEHNIIYWFNQNCRLSAFEYNHL